MSHNFCGGISIHTHTHNQFASGKEKTLKPFIARRLNVQKLSFFFCSLHRLQPPRSSTGNKNAHIIDCIVSCEFLKWFKWNMLAVVWRMAQYENIRNEANEMSLGIVAAGESECGGRFWLTSSQKMNKPATEPIFAYTSLTRTTNWRKKCSNNPNVTTKQKIYS